MKAQGCAISFAWLLFLFPACVWAEYSQGEVARAIRQAGGLENFLLHIIRQTNKQTPVRLDENFELMMATLPTPRSIGYNTKIQRHTLSDIKNKAALKHIMFERSVNVLCTSPVSSVLLGRYGVSYLYNVYSMTGEYVFDYEIRMKDCQK